MRRTAVGKRLLWIAFATGTVHAAFSVYWALGGHWLLATVGQWAVRLVDRSPLWAGAALALIGVVKLAGAVVPILVEKRKLAGRRWWRRAEACGAGGLLFYGALNIVVAWAVLGGLITTAGGYDHAAELGHAALWDPLFFVWGACLAGGLALTRHSATSSWSTDH